METVEQHLIEQADRTPCLAPCPVCGAVRGEPCPDGTHTARRLLRLAELEAVACERVGPRGVT